MDDAWRLTFAFDGDAVSLKSMRRLTKRVPRERPRDTDAAGLFIEVRDADGQSLYRRSITAIVPRTVEYPTGNPERPFGRVRGAAKGEVSVLVPAMADGHVAAIVELSRARRKKSKKGQQQKAATAALQSRDLVQVELTADGDKHDRR